MLNDAVLRPNEQVASDAAGEQEPNDHDGGRGFCGYPGSLGLCFSNFFLTSKLANFWQNLRGPFSAVSTPNFYK